MFWRLAVCFLVVSFPVKPLPSRSKNCCAKTTEVSADNSHEKEVGFSRTYPTQFVVKVGWNFEVIESNSGLFTIKSINLYCLYCTLRKYSFSWWFFTHMSQTNARKNSSKFVFSGRSEGIRWMFLRKVPIEWRRKIPMTHCVSTPWEWYIYLSFCTENLC